MPSKPIDERWNNLTPEDTEKVFKSMLGIKSEIGKRAELEADIAAFDRVIGILHKQGNIWSRLDLQSERDKIKKQLAALEGENHD